MSKGGVLAGAYQYDGRGLRTVKTVNGETTLFIYCKSGRLIAEADSDANILKEYVYLEGDIFAHFQYEVPAAAPEAIVADNELLPEPAPEPVIDSPVVAATSTSSNTAFLPAVYLVLLMKNSSTGSWATSVEGAYYYITDHLGAPQIITNDAGSVVWQAEYLPFGKVNILTAEIENNLRFPGQYYDAETGLHYNWNRYYSPETGRYIAADPIGLGGGINLYAYVGSDPVNGVDPWGMAAAEAVEAWILWDASTPEPSDAAWMKWAGYCALLGGAVAADYVYDMAAHGNQADTQIQQDYGEYASNEKLNCRPPNDKCKWLEANKGNYTQKQYKATAKAWGCKPCRVSKDKKNR